MGKPIPRIRSSETEPRQDDPIQQIVSRFTRSIIDLLQRVEVTKRDSKQKNQFRNFKNDTIYKYDVKTFPEYYQVISLQNHYLDQYHLY
jgi:hypothetical protein